MKKNSKPLSPQQTMPSPDKLSQAQALETNSSYLGRLGKTFGLQGGIRFYGIAEAETEAIYSLTSIYIPDIGEKTIAKVEDKGAAPVIFFEGITHIDGIKPFVGFKVYTAREKLPEPQTNDFYLEDVIGLPVILDGQPFGEIIDIIDASSQDLVVIRHQEREHLVPLQADYVVLTETALLINNVPEGLFDL
jgi:16S rRNA processing protein RimM